MAFINNMEKDHPGYIEEEDEDDLFEGNDHSCCRDILSNKPTSDSTFKIGSPKSLPSLSPKSQRRYGNVGNDVFLGTSPPKVVTHMPRDPIQPRSGSISDVHSEASVEDEEIDFFSEDMAFRPRSHTCPENHSLQRKAKVRLRNRPLTPPPSPGGAYGYEIDHHLFRLSLKERLPFRDLPSFEEQENDEDIKDDFSDDNQENTESDVFIKDDCNNKI